MAEIKDRPLSPHLQVWRWHATMASSIFHRATGVALYGGALILAGWALALASGAGAYDGYMTLLGSPLGRLVMLGLTLSIFYHLANGIRHIVFDAGKGFALKAAEFGAWMAIAFAVVATAAVWFLASMTGAI